MRIQNLKFKIQNISQNRDNSGFTVIELMVVIAVMAVVGSIIGGIFFSSLRGANKATVVTRVRQNGNYAISQMSRMIRYAERFEGVSNTPGNPASFVNDCTTFTSANTFSSIKITSFDGGNTIFSCNAPLISSNSASLIDPNVSQVTACQFTCSQIDGASPARININFTLSQLTSAGLFADTKVAIPFRTSVTFRNVGL